MAGTPCSCRRICRYYLARSVSISWHVGHAEIGGSVGIPGQSRQAYIAGSIGKSGQVGLADVARSMRKSGHVGLAYVARSIGHVTLDCTAGWLGKCEHIAMVKENRGVSSWRISVDLQEDPGIPRRQM